MIYGYGTEYIATKPPNAIPTTSVAAKTYVAEVGNDLPAAHDTRSLAEVVSEARKIMDEGRVNLGKAADFYIRREEMDKAGFSLLDRRQLYAVMANIGGLFSDVEQGIAGAEMGQRNQEIWKVDPTGHSSRFIKAEIDFLEDAGPEEKASFAWAKQRAGAQWVYEKRVKSEGGTVEEFQHGNSLVHILLQAWRELSKSEGTGKTFEDMPAYIEAQQLFGFQEPENSVIDWTL